MELQADRRVIYEPSYNIHTQNTLEIVDNRGTLQKSALACQAGSTLLKV